MMMVKFDERSKALRDKKTNLIEFKKMHAVPSVRACLFARLPQP